MHTLPKHFSGVEAMGLIENEAVNLSPDVDTGTQLDVAPLAPNPHHFIVAPQCALPVDAAGNPWLGSYVYASGNLVLDLMYNLMLESTGRLQKCRIYEMSDNKTLRSTVSLRPMRSRIASSICSARATNCTRTRASTERADTYHAAAVTSSNGQPRKLLYSAGPVVSRADSSLPPTVSTRCLAARSPRGQSADIHPRGAEATPAPPRHPRSAPRRAASERRTRPSRRHDGRPWPVRGHNGTGSRDCEPARDGIPWRQPQGGHPWSDGDGRRR